MSDPIHIFVAGFGRCGTTAMMQMLWTGGAQTASPAPAFEDTRLSRNGLDLDWVKAQRGRALKYIDPIACPLPSAIRAKTIWLDRAPYQQAKSQVKLVAWGGDLHPAAVGITPDALERSARAMAKDLKRDRSKSLAQMRKHGPVEIIRFEDLIKKPHKVALAVRCFLDGDLQFDPNAGATAILKRGPECQADMWIEESTAMAWDMQRARA